MVDDNEASHVDKPVVLFCMFVWQLFAKGKLTVA